MTRGGLSIREITKIFWLKKSIFLVVFLISSVVGVGYSLSLNDIYRSEALVAPSDTSNSKNAGNLMSQVGGLAGLAGINLPSTGVSNEVQVAIETLRSRIFVSEFITDYNLKPLLFAVDEYNLKLQQVVYVEEIYNSNKNVWLADDGPRTKYSDWEAVDEFLKRLQISQDEQTGFIQLSFDHMSPEVSKSVLDNLIDSINQRMRLKEIDEAERSIKFLERELKSTKLANSQQIFYQLIETQVQKVMLANVRPEYVFQRIQPPTLPEKKAMPSRALICIGITLFSLFLTSLVIFLKYVAKEDKQAESREF